MTESRDGEALSHLADLAGWTHEGLLAVGHSIAWPGVGRQLAIRALEVLEETAATISPELKERHPRLEWNSFGSARACLAASYRHLDYELLERVIDQLLDALNNMLDAELGESEAD